MIRRAIIVGSGGVGFWLVAALRRDRPTLEIIVYDSDDFEGGFGASRLPHVVNKQTKKVEYLSTFLQVVLRERGVTPRPERFTADTVAQYSPEYWAESLVVDASDMPLTARRPIWDACRSAGAQLLRVSYDGTDNGIVVISKGLPFGTTPTGNYVNVPTFAQSLWAGGVGATAVGMVLDGLAVQDIQMQVPVSL